jgi:hypothetical protein
LIWNDYALDYFKKLRLELKARGLLDKFFDELHALVDPDGRLSGFEVIDESTLEQWRAAAAAAERGDESGGARQLGFGEARTSARGQG